MISGETVRVKRYMYRVLPLTIRYDRHLNIRVGQQIFSLGAQQGRVSMKNIYSHHKWC